MKYQVGSEVTQLKQVILQRPGREMLRLTPSNKDRLLFDDVPWLERAQHEHDVFAQTLRSQGVEVLYFTQLLQETLALPAAREYLTALAFDEFTFGSQLSEALHELSEKCSPEELTDLLIAGISKRELLTYVSDPHSVFLDSLAPEELVLNPLPNHLFTRDTSAWIYDGVSVNSMRKRARRRESYHYDTIYRFHPRFATAQFKLWADTNTTQPATVEGGDILIIGSGAVLMGISERTTPQGVERLARRLFAAESASVVVALQLPQKRSMMHLDTVLTMLDHDTFTVYQNLGMLPSVTLRPGTGKHPLHVQRNDAEEMYDVIGTAAGLNTRPRILITPQDQVAAEREQWDDGCNFLTVRPGVVIGYERNFTTNEYLASEGIEILAVPGSELGRGRGGPRCMSCPTQRATS